MKNRYFLFPGIWLLMLLFAIPAKSVLAKSYVYQSGEKSHVARDNFTSPGTSAVKSRQDALKMSAAWRHKAEVYLAQGNFIEAVKAATRALGYAGGVTENYMVRARAFAGLGDFTKASRDWRKILEIVPNSSEAYNGLGELSQQAGNLAQAEKYYKKSCGMDNADACSNLERLTNKNIDNPDEEFKRAATSEDLEKYIEKYKPSELAFVAVQRQAAPYLKVRDWQGAAAVFQKHQQDFPENQKRFTDIIALLLAPEEGLDMRNIGPTINTEKGEYDPVISADAGRLYFGRDRGNAAGGEDIYVAEMQDGQWGKATNLGPPLNTATHEVPLSISADGNTIALFGNYPESLGRGDIFYADKTSTCWTSIRHYPPPINSQYFESNAMFTADGKSILFVSERPGGVGEFHKKDDFFHGSYGGNTDIYVYTQNANGEYEVINLGDKINTPYSEYSPYLHPDGKTLYFSSDGHYGLGGLDVFKSTRLSDTSWTEWSEPVNLGKEINGPNNDWGYQITTAGDWAYFSASDRLDGFGANDIYMAQLPKNAKPRPVTTVSGKVTDSDGNIVENVEIKWNDIALQKEVGEARSDPQTGKYFIALPAGRLYGYYAMKEGYMGRSEEVDLTDKVAFSEYTVDIMMYPVGKIKKETLAIRLNNVFFDIDKWDLKTESSLELDRWVELLTEHNDIIAQINGHTDSTGPDAYNMELSRKRAASVVNYLVGKGIDSNRLVARGFGESSPVASNATREGRKLNRRVEIQFNGISSKTPSAGTTVVPEQSATSAAESPVTPSDITGPETNPVEPSAAAVDSESVNEVQEGEAINPAEDQPMPAATSQPVAPAVEPGTPAE